MRRRRFLIPALPPPAGASGQLGTSTNGLLVYGYDLGDADDLKLIEAQESDDNEFGYLRVPWWTPPSLDDDEDDDTDEDVFEAVRRVLYDSIPGLPPVEDDWEREDPIWDHLGVKLVDYCSGSSPMYILATHEITVYRGDTVLIEWANLAQLAEEQQWDVKLAHALRVLGVTPTQERPGWLLASYWGC